jgi:SAM-dependent methyltransferase
LIEERRMSHRVRIVRGDVRALDFPDGSFDAIVCLEAAGDICVTERDKDRLVRDLRRVLRPGGHVGFSDLALRACPSQREDHALRAVLYHSGAELVTDWPALFVRHGFTIVERGDIIADTIETWDRVREAYEQRSVEGRPPLRPPARPPNPRADRADSADTRQVRNLPRSLRAQVIATKIALPETLAPSRPAAASRSTPASS